MLSQNIKTLRKSKGLSQEELARRLNVVRQTVSKWEQGISVPDAELLIDLSEILETPVSTLLGETVPAIEPNEIMLLSEKLESINGYLAQRKASRRKAWHWFFIALCIITVLIGVVLVIEGSPYLNWDLSDPELAVAGTAYHAFEWIFFKAAPFLLIGGIAGALLTRKKA